MGCDVVGGKRVSVTERVAWPDALVVYRLVRPPVESGVRLPVREVLFLARFEWFDQL